MNQQVHFTAFLGPNGHAIVQYFNVTTPLGTFSMTQEQFKALQTRGAFYTHPAWVWIEQNPNLNFEDTLEYTVYCYGTDNPVYVAWESMSTYCQQGGTQSHISDSVVVFVGINPDYGSYSSYQINGAVIRYSLCP